MKGWVWQMATWQALTNVALPFALLGCNALDSQPDRGADQEAPPSFRTPTPAGSTQGVGSTVTTRESVPPSSSQSSDFVSDTDTGPNWCGNGFTADLEDCDDGNQESGDGCSEDCTIEAGHICSGLSCWSTCGDGVLAPGGRHPEQCDDSNQQGGDGCSHRCMLERDHACNAEGQPCEYLGVCGDGVLQSKEQCDLGGDVNTVGCTADCTTLPGYACSGGAAPCEPLCGDGLMVGDEECDDGNRSSVDGCDAHCRIEPGSVCSAPGRPCRLTQCGDQIREGLEACDDGNLVPGDGCSERCRLEPDCSRGPDDCRTFCGDAWIGDVNVFAGAPLEQCDDGNLVAGDGCDAQCQLEVGFTCSPVRESTEAGVGVIDLAEGTADAGAPPQIVEAGVNSVDSGPTLPRSNRGAAARLLDIDVTSCSPICGDGLRVGTELCDDGDANSNEYGSCWSDCRSLPRCGDGLVTHDEQCDDGSNNAHYYVEEAACGPNCRFPPFCGDGVVAPEWGEECDLGTDLNDGSYGACTPQCTLGPHCGDGLTDQGRDANGYPIEDCDDGNYRENDGCDENCRREKRYVP